ncbi:MAG: protein kinase [Candidatus Aminicenantes bacterium]|nr:protein kinase [Candidatus Aminicenantes bacterium]
MECPNCHSENKHDSKFCSNCATPLNLAEAALASLTKTLATSLPAVSKDALIAGKYRIFEEIGRGGMGVVYMAEDIKLQRTVALKFLPPHLADSTELRERFLIEARAAAALSHPNICVIHEVGETEDRPYIAMEYVEGETLREKIKKKPLKPEEALAIIGQVAAGLGEAHRKGIVHRDIKSANTMVTTKGRAKVMDFGLAKLRGGSSLTKSQTTLGTVAYMSPEQARGDEVDGRTDLWSLGVVLYEMLTGVLPFKGDRDLSIIHSIIHEDPNSIKLRKPPVPLELQQVVARALRKNREARYSSAEELLKDLRTYEEALRAEASGFFNLRSLLKRLRRPVVAIPAALAVVAIASAAFFFFKHQSKVRWAREVVLPEIERMIEENDVWRNLVPPYRLAEKAEAILGNDPKLAELFSKCSLRIDVRTEPSGAGVYLKEYETPAAEWFYLGVTPLEKIRAPIGIFRWKFEKEGYETVLAASSTWNAGGVVGQPGTVIPYDIVRALDKEGSIPPGMVRVQGAETTVGKLDDFFIDRYEVTNRQYKEFVDAGGYRKMEVWKHPFVRDGRELTWEEAMREFVDPTAQPGPSTWQARDYPDGQADHPVSGVSWYEAAAYAEYAGKSLPTTAHWNVTSGAYTPVIQFPQLGGFAVLAPFSNFGGQGSVPVGSLHGLTPYGAFDMAGNVREWCWNEAPQGRVIRGGAWGDNTYEFGRQGQVPPWDRSSKNGFRCALFPDREKIPDKAFQFVGLGETRDFYKEKPAADAIFQVYKEQFSYDKTELNARVESREESPEGWIHEKVVFDAAYGGEKVLAHLFLPKNAPPPFQTVIYFPGSASTWERSSWNIESFYEFTMFLSFLVKNGRAVLYPVYKGTFERGNPAMTALHGGAPSYQYTEFLIQVVKDFRRSIDYLETRPDINSGKLAYYGMSWGGFLGAIIPAVEERLKASVLLGGGLVSAGRPEANEFNYVTLVRTPTLMLNGRYDNALEAGINPMFDLLGTPDKNLKLYDTNHIPPRNEFVKETLAWLDKYLGPVKR